MIESINLIYTNPLLNRPLLNCLTTSIPSAPSRSWRSSLLYSIWVTKFFILRLTYWGWQTTSLLLELLDFLGLGVLARGWRGFGAATLMAAAVSPREGSYSSPELTLTGDAARFFLDFLWPMSKTDVGVGVIWNEVNSLTIVYNSLQVYCFYV